MSNDTSRWSPEGAALNPWVPSAGTILRGRNCRPLRQKPAKDPCGGPEDPSRPRNVPSSIGPAQGPCSCSSRPDSAAEGGQDAGLPRGPIVRRAVRPERPRPCAAEVAPGAGGAELTRQAGVAWISRTVSIRSGKRPSRRDRASCADSRRYIGAACGKRALGDQAVHHLAQRDAALVALHDLPGPVHHGWPPDPFRRHPYLYLYPSPPPWRSRAGRSCSGVAARRLPQRASTSGPVAVETAAAARCAPGTDGAGGVQCVPQVARQILRSGLFSAASHTAGVGPPVSCPRRWGRSPGVSGPGRGRSTAPAAGGA
jgi:hypothetical protein